MSTVPFDRSVLKVNQVILMSLLVGAWLLSLATRWGEIAIPLLAAMMLHGAARPEQSVPRLLYRRLLAPRGLVRPRVVVEDPAPHRFAQLVGGAFLAVAAVLAAVGVAGAAWALAWIVVALAFLNFAFDVCVGCVMYAQLARAGLLAQQGPRG